MLRTIGILRPKLTHDLRICTHVFVRRLHEDAFLLAVARKCVSRVDSQVALVTHCGTNESFSFLQEIINSLVGRLRTIVRTKLRAKAHINNIRHVFALSKLLDFLNVFNQLSVHETGRYEVEISQRSITIQTITYVSSGCDVRHVSCVTMGRHSVTA